MPLVAPAAGARASARARARAAASQVLLAGMGSVLLGKRSKQAIPRLRLARNVPGARRARFRGGSVGAGWDATKRCNAAFRLKRDVPRGGSPGRARACGARASCARGRARGPLRRGASAPTRGRRRSAPARRSAPLPEGDAERPSGAGAAARARRPRLELGRSSGQDGLPAADRDARTRERSRARGRCRASRSASRARSASGERRSARPCARRDAGEEVRARAARCPRAARAAAAPRSGRRAGGSRGPRGSAPRGPRARRSTVGGGDDARVGSRAAGSRRRARSVRSCSTRRSLHLERERQVADLVEEERARRRPARSGRRGRARRR